MPSWIVPRASGGLTQMREELGMGRENAGMVQRVMELPEREV